MKNIIKLSVISEVDAQSHAILKVQEGSVIMRGGDEDGYDFECGNCNEVLATNVFHQQIRNIVLICNRCGKHNIIRFDWSVYIFKYFREEINYSAVLVGLILALSVSIYTDFSVLTKIVITVVTVVLSLFYKTLVQIFQENN
ncbi:MAG: hypothetical protein NUW02_02595 [Candidatus Campbellbacteria bacterium]|nr:hypothetical protein [Candidatus Campbellbacteria bacterium]